MIRPSSCSACGRGSFRYRKRADDFVCRRCGNAVRADQARGEALAETQLRRLHRRSTSGRACLDKDARGRRELFDALADMENACNDLDEAARAVSRQHDPAVCLPLLLAPATGGIVAAVAARSLRWWFVGLASFTGALVMFFLLMAFRVVGWMRHHPLLAQTYKLRHRLTRGGDAAEYALLELNEAIVDRYLPPEVSKPLLFRLQAAKARVEALLGLPDGPGEAPRR